MKKNVYVTTVPKVRNSMLALIIQILLILLQYSGEINLQWYVLYIPCLFFVPHFLFVILKCVDSYKRRVEAQNECNRILKDFNKFHPDIFSSKEILLKNKPTVYTSWEEYLDI